MTECCHQNPVSGKGDEFSYWRSRLIVAAPLTFILWAVMPSLIVQLILTSVIYFWCGWPFLKGMVHGFFKLKPDMNTLIGFGASSAFWYSTVVILFPNLAHKIGAWEKLYF